MFKHLISSNCTIIYMFQDVLKQLKIITGELQITNNHLRLIEEHLRVPDMRYWSQVLKEIKKSS